MYIKEVVVCDKFVNLYIFVSYVTRFCFTVTLIINHLNIYLSSIYHVHLSCFLVVESEFLKEGGLLNRPRVGGKCVCGRGAHQWFSMYQSWIHLCFNCYEIEHCQSVRTYKTCKNSKKRKIYLQWFQQFLFYSNPKQNFQICFQTKEVFCFHFFCKLLNPALPLFY